MKRSLFISALALLAGAPSFVLAEQAAPGGAPEVLEMVPYDAPVEEASENPVIEEQYQLQLLQRDVMEMRGLLEELKFQLDTMKAISDDRYLELDRRLQNLTQGGAVAAAGDGEGASTTGATAAPAFGPAEQVEPGAMSDKDIYDTAIELIRNRQYDVAITQLRGLIEQYPESSYTANAYYWIGEVYAAMPEPNYEESRKALAQVITFFPDNAKAADAAFKLGKVYHLMGNCERGKEILEQVAEQHQGKSVGKLAEAYLRDKIDC